MLEKKLHDAVVVNAAAVASDDGRDCGGGVDCDDPYCRGQMRPLRVLLPRAQYCPLLVYHCRCYCY